MVREVHRRHVEARETEPGFYTKIFAEMETKFGPLWGQILEAGRNGEMTGQEMGETLDEAPDFQEFQTKGLELLELYGVVEYEQGRTLVDIEKLKGFTIGAMFYDDSSSSFAYRTKEIKKYLGDDHADKYDAVKDHLEDLGTKYGVYTGGKDVRSFLFNTFYGREVIDKYAWMKAKQEDGVSTLPESKPLFYTPENRDAAFDPEKIKKERFHIGLWELNSSVGNSDTYSPFHPDIPYDEACLAAMLYHPRYGAAEREKGRLLVAQVDPSTGTYDPSIKKPITYDWFGGVGVNSPLFQDEKNGKSVPGGLTMSPRAFLEQGGAPLLQHHDLLRPSDFRAMAGGKATEVAGFYRDITHKKGMVALEDKIRYTVGKKYGDGTHMIQKISDELYGIVEKDHEGNPLKLVAVLDRVHSEDPDLKEVTNTIVPYQTVGLRDLQGRNALREFDATNPELFLPRKKGETDEAYEQRAQGVLGFAEFLKVRKEVEKETGVSFNALSPREQSGFLSYFQSADEDTRGKLLGFVKKYKKDGLMTFLAVHQDPSLAEKIFSIENNYDTAEAALIFRRFAETVSAAHRVDAELQEFFTDKDRAEKVDDVMVTEEMVRRAGETIIISPNQKDLPGIISALEHTYKDTIRFAAILKEAYADKKHINVSEIKGLDFHTVSGSGLSLSEKEKIMALLVKSATNDAAIESMKQLLFPSSGEGLTRLAINTFTLLSRKSGQEDELYSVVREEKRAEDRVYIGGFAVARGAQGTKIGDAMMQHLAEQHYGKDNIDLVAIPEIAAGTHYVSAWGAVGKAYKDRVSGTSNGWFELEISKTPQKFKLRSREMKDTNDVMQQYGNIEDIEKHIGDPVIVMKMDVSTEMDKVKEVCSKLMNEHGYQLVRYQCLNKSCSERLFGFELP